VWVDGVWPDALVEGLALALPDLPPALAVVVVAEAWPPQHAAAKTLVARARRVLRPGLLAPHARWGLFAEAAFAVRVSSPPDFDPVLLEGLRVGTPLVLADVPLARELAGEEAVFVAPDEVEGWAQALVEVATNAQRRSELARSGPARSTRFSWIEHARVTLAAYEALHAGSL
jgi:glycosyltransferase involved in cell wall biosynthesis